MFIYTFYTLHMIIMKSGDLIVGSSIASSRVSARPSVWERLDFDPELLRRIVACGAIEEPEPPASSSAHQRRWEKTSKDGEPPPSATLENFVYDIYVVYDWWCHSTDEPVPGSSFLVTDSSQDAPQI